MIPNKGTWQVASRLSVENRPSVPKLHFATALRVKFKVRLAVNDAFDEMVCPSSLLLSRSDKVNLGRYFNACTSGV
jgi:hypothetical protein